MDIAAVTGEQVHKLMARWRSWIIAALLIGLIFEVTGTGKYTSMPAAVSLKILILMIIVLMALLMLRPIDQKQVEAKPQPQFPSPQAVDSKQGRLLQQRAGLAKVVDARQAKIFALAITAPAQVRKRVTDSYQLDERTLLQTVTIDVEIPRGHRPTRPDQSPLVYFPVVVPSKGHLFDDLSVTTGNDEELPVLTYREYLIVAVSVLRLLLVSACRGQPNVNGSGMTAKALEVEQDAVELLIKRNTRAIPIGRETVREVVASIESLPGLAGDNALAKSVREAREMTAKFVEKLSDHYVIIAPIEPTGDGRFLVKYKQVLIPELELGRRKIGWLSKLIGSATVAFGTRPLEVTIGIDNASTCQSFHLWVEGSEGLYLRNQEAIEFAQTLQTTARDAPTRPHARFRRRLGQSHAHFYVRYFPEPAVSERPRLRFTYAETPPGSLFRAAVTAVASALLIWVVGGLTTLGKAPTTDVPAILLAFPALAAAWLGFDDKLSNRLLTGTIAGRVCLALTVAFSIAASALFVAQVEVSGTGVQNWTLPWGLSFLWVNHGTWAILLLLAFANAVVSSYKYMVSTWTYCYLASRPQEGSTVTRRV